MRSSALCLLLSGVLAMAGATAWADDGFVAGFDLPEGATYVGSETCLDCHDEIGAFYAHSPHSVEMNLLVPGTSVGACEACHGPGSIHAAEEDADAIINLEMMRAMSGVQRDKMCLQCHTDVHQGYAAGPHSGTGVSCADCHGDQVQFAVEARPAADFRNESEFCLQCHPETAADFRMPFRHRVLEDQIMCGDCHDPHNGIPANTWNGLNETCLTCHTEKAGPFIFEHDGVQGEDCTTCHNPHGSMNDKMLLADGNTLCLQCHYETTFNTDDSWQIADTNHGGMLTGGGLCIDCHAEIHGSNVAPSFRDQ